MSAQDFMDETEEIKPLDPNDFSPKKVHVGNWSIFVLIMSTIFHIVDIGSDVYLMISYFEDGKYWYGIWTLYLIVVPALMVTICSVDMINKTPIHCVRSSFWQSFAEDWIVRVLIFFSLSAISLRSIDCLNIARKLRLAEKEKDKEKQEKYYKMYRYEDGLRNMLLQHDIFLETMPQLLLQVTIFFMEYNIGSKLNISQLFSVSSSFVSFVASMCTINTNSVGIRLHARPTILSLENTRPENQIKETLLLWRRIGNVIKFGQYFCLISSRILCISFVASIFPLYTTIAIGFHWAFFALILHFQYKANKRYSTAILKTFETIKLYKIKLGYIFAVFSHSFIQIFRLRYFIFVNEEGNLMHVSFPFMERFPFGRQNRRDIFFGFWGISEVILVVENITASIIFGIFTLGSLNTAWFYDPFIIIPNIGLLLGFTFAFFHYLCPDLIIFMVDEKNDNNNQRNDENGFVMVNNSAILFL